MTIGQRLAAVRTKKGLELEKVAHDTRLRVQRLRELEADDYSHCPHPSYARMFLKDYAKYLGIPFSEIKDELPEAGECGAGGYQYLDELSGESVPVPTVRRLKPRRRFLPFALASTALVLVGVVGLNGFILLRKLSSLGIGKPEESAAETLPAETAPAATKLATLVAEDVALLNETVSETAAAEAFAPVPATLAAPAATPDERAAFLVGGGLDPEGRVQ